MIDEKERTALDFALGQLRMAYDLRAVGEPGAVDYEREARRALAQVLDVEYDLMREEGDRPRTERTRIQAQQPERDPLRGAWTCGNCGFRGFWSGGPHCTGTLRELPPTPGRDPFF